MNNTKIDARGLSCPQPVLLTNKTIKDGIEKFQILVNSEVSKENVLRCVEKNNKKAVVNSDGEDFIISVS